MKEYMKQKKINANKYYDHLLSYKRFVSSYEKRMTLTKLVLCELVNYIV